MSELISQTEPITELLTRDLAERYIHQLTALANQIPGVTYTAEEVLADQKGARQMLGKWAHSLVVLQEDEPIAFIMGYERAAEGNEQYPENTIYVSELAVVEAHQGKGIAKGLMRSFFERNNSIGFQFLEGEPSYSIQTNSAVWNAHVVEMYKSFGFTERAKKEYPNRVDVVLGVKASELQI